MIKGCQKRIIHITDTGSPYFEEAFFLLRRCGDIENCSEEDIVKEATRIADSCLGTVRHGEKRRKARNKRIKCFLAGASVCSFLFGAAALTLSLVF